MTKLLSGRAGKLALCLAVAWSVWRCGDAMTGPNTVNVAGNWSGTETDRLGPARLTWTLTQVGPNVTGTVTMRPLDATDGSCASCHKLKDGTLAGTVAGRTLTFSMYFAAGGQTDPTPACSINISSTTSVTPSAIAGTYEGTDPCEGFFDGTLTMVRKP